MGVVSDVTAAGSPADDPADHAAEEPAWSEAEVVADFATDGVSDAGELAALRAVRSWIYGRDLLDLGVGGGRTTGFLLPRARSYVGVDVAPGMLALARERFPGADLREGDAADLSAHPDAAYDLVLFSFNGLDSLDHAGRARALREMHRVLRPGGRVLFSSLNRDGISFDERPLRVPGGPLDARFRYHVRHYLRHPGSLVRSVRNHRRARREGEDGPGWATRPMRELEFRFVVHFTTLGALVAETRAAGFDVLAAYGDDGTALDLTVETTDADYVHVVATPAAVPS